MHRASPEHLFQSKVCGGQPGSAHVDEGRGLQLHLLRQVRHQRVGALSLVPVRGQDPGQAEGVVEQALPHKDLSGLLAEEDIGQGEDATLDAAPG